MQRSRERWGREPPRNPRCKEAVERGRWPIKAPPTNGDSHTTVGPASGSWGGDKQLWGKDKDRGPPIGGCWARGAQAAGPEPGGASERRRRGSDSLAGETYGPKPCKCVLSRGLGSAIATPPRGVAQVSRSPATPPSSAPGSGPREGGRGLCVAYFLRRWPRQPAVLQGSGFLQPLGSSCSAWLAI